MPFRETDVGGIFTAAQGRVINNVVMDEGAGLVNLQGYSQVKHGFWWGIIAGSYRLPTGVGQARPGTFSTFKSCQTYFK